MHSIPLSKYIFYSLERIDFDEEAAFFDPKA